MEPVPIEAVEQLPSRWPEMFTAPDSELRGRKVTLDRGVQQAVEKDLSTAHAENRLGILSRHVDVSQRALRGTRWPRWNPSRSSSGPGCGLFKLPPHGMIPQRASVLFCVLWR